MINAERIVEMKRLTAEATPGPWFVNRFDSSVKAVVGVFICTQGSEQYDAQFIAESRQFVPDIIAAYDETKKQSAFWYEQFVNMTDAHAEQADEIAKLRKALEFYADRESWAFHANEYDVHDDRGMTARDALK